MSLLLFEAGRKETEDYLKRLYEQGGGDKYILSFSIVNKYGINVNPYDKTTPLGVYGYLLKHLFLHYDGDIRKLPYGADRPYILVLKIKPDAKVLVASKITSSDVEKLFNYLSQYAVDSLKQELKNVLNKKISPSKRFLTLLSYIPTVFITTDPNKQYILLRNIFVNLGYDIVIDDGIKLIHDYEPYQVVILNLNKAEHVETLYNPYAKTKPKEEKDFRIVYHKSASPVNGFVFTVLKNRLNLNDKRIADKLFFFLKKLNPFMTRKIYERFLSEIKPIIKQIYDRYNEQNYNPIEAVMKYLVNFTSELLNLSRKYRFGKFSLSDVQFMMHNYLMDRDWKKYIDLFPVNIKDTLNETPFLEDIILHSIRFQLDRETITKLADRIHENWKEINWKVPASIGIAILKMSQNNEHHEFANSLIEKTSPFPSFSLETIDKLVDILQSKQISIDKIANVVTEFLHSSQLLRLITEIEIEHENNDFSDKKRLLQLIIKKFKEFVDKVTGHLLTQSERNLLIKTGVKKLLYELNKNR